MTLQTKLAQIKAPIFWGIIGVVIVLLGVISINTTQATSNSQRTKEIAKQLRCLECEGLSVYESDTSTSKSIVADVKKRVEKGQSSESIFQHYEDAYGEYIRLSPTTNNGNWLIYVIPVFLVTVFLIALYLSIRKNVSRKLIFGFWITTALLFVSLLVVFTQNAKTKPQATIKPLTDIERLQNTVRNQPTAGNYRNLAIVFFAQEKYVDALKSFDRAVELDPNDVESRAYASYIVFLSGQYDKAMQRIDKAYEIDPQSIPVLFFRGVIYSETPQDDQAVKESNNAQAQKDFDEVLSRAPDSAFARQIQEVRASK